jgi:hypothetical protein
MEEGEIGVLVQDCGDVYSLTNTLKGDEELFALVEGYLNKKACTLVTIYGTEKDE